MIAGIHLYGQISLSSLLNATYTQNFDSLAISGTGHSWVNNTTIPGWYLSRATYNADNGGSSTISAYSYGSTGSTERALGSVAGATTTAGAIGYGVTFFNDTTRVYSGFDIQFTGEQWRRANNVDPHRLQFGYKISSSLLTNPLDVGFSSAPSLDFVTPITGAPTAALDGNLPANSDELAAALPFAQTLDPGEYIMFTWVDVGDPNADHGLAIDNLSIEIPESDGLRSIIALLLTAGAWGLVGSRRQQSSGAATSIVQTGQEHTTST